MFHADPVVPVVSDGTPGESNDCLFTETIATKFCSQVQRSEWSCTLPCRCGFCYLLITSPAVQPSVLVGSTVGVNIPLSQTLQVFEHPLFHVASGNLCSLGFCLFVCCNHESIMNFHLPIFSAMFNNHVGIAYLLYREGLGKSEACGMTSK